MSDNTEDAGTEPRDYNYPVAGALPPLIDVDELQTMRALSEAGIGYVEYLDTWIDKGIADGTLAIGKAARYREAIARRCAELGEVPHRQEHIARLDLKPGDILAVIAPFDEVPQLRQMGESVKQFLKYVGADGVEVVVFPRGTELRALDRQPKEAAPEVDVQPEPEKAPPNIHIQFHGGPADGNASSAMTARVRAVMAEEIRRTALYGPGHQ